MVKPPQLHLRHFAVLIVPSVTLNLNPFAETSTRNFVLRSCVNLKWYTPLQNKRCLLDLLVIMESLEAVPKKEIQHNAPECTRIKHKCY